MISLERLGGPVLLVDEGERAVLRALHPLEGLQVVRRGVLRAGRRDEGCGQHEACP
jgi:hypothetical protein